MGRDLKLHNHKRRILGLQPSPKLSLYPGMICKFRYKKENASDPQPLILVVWNDYDKYKLHGINLNYLTDYQIRKIMSDLSDRGEQVGDDLPITVEDQEEQDYDDNLPNRNLIKKPFTRLKLPTYKEEQDGIKLSKSQAEQQMKRLYNSVLKKYVTRLQVYRTYSYDNIKSPRVVSYDVGGLIK